MSSNGAGITVTFGGAPAQVFCLLTCDTQFVAFTPAHDAGVVDVTVTAAAGSGTLPGAFTYVGVSPTAPVVNTISPTSGDAAGGTNLTIVGTGFQPGATVMIGGVAATNVTIQDAMTITATTAAHDSGVADVVVSNLDGQSGTKAGAFTYTAPTTTAPVISGITPTSGPASGNTGGGDHGGQSLHHGLERGRDHRDFRREAGRGLLSAHL